MKKRYRRVTIRVWVGGADIFLDYFMMLIQDYVCTPNPKLLAKNDLPSIHTHSLRHTFATLLINMGTDTKSVSTALGHSQTQITNDIYVHIFEEHSAKISNSLCDSLLNTATE